MEALGRALAKRDGQGEPRRAQAAQTGPAEDQGADGRRLPPAPVRRPAPPAIAQLCGRRQGCVGLAASDGCGAAVDATSFERSLLDRVLRHLSARLRARGSRSHVAAASIPFSHQLVPFLRPPRVAAAARDEEARLDHLVRRQQQLPRRQRASSPVSSRRAKRPMEHGCSAIAERVGVVERRVEQGDQAGQGKAWQPVARVERHQPRFAWRVGDARLWTGRRDAELRSARTTAVETSGRASSVGGCRAQCRAGRILRTRRLRHQLVACDTEPQQDRRAARDA